MTESKVERTLEQEKYIFFLKGFFHSYPPPIQGTTATITQEVTGYAGITNRNISNAEKEERAIRLAVDNY